MDQFLQKLNEMKEVQEIITHVQEGEVPVALTGLQMVQRACIGAAVAKQMKRPSLFVCGDERELRQMAQDLTTLLGVEPIQIVGREWQFRSGALASREWERGRLAALSAMVHKKASVILATPEGLMQRTMPPKLLKDLSKTLKVGERADVRSLADTLLSAGYERADQVEGVGQFALRGGILDVFSPLMEHPIRCEFFDDEIDSMGAFDVGTQRRIENVEQCTLLPAAEVLPKAAEGGLEGLSDRLLILAQKLSRRQKTQTIVANLEEDSERFRNGSVPGGMDRYLCAVYPEETTAFDYLPKNTMIFLCEDGRIEDHVKTMALQQEQDLEILLDVGTLAGDYAKLTLTPQEFYAKVERCSVVEMSSLPTSRHPIAPRALMSMNVRQLSTYGGSLETAVNELMQYRLAGSAVLLLCSGEQRAKNLLQMLEEREIPATLDLKGKAMPQPGEVRISVGSLSAGCEWPVLKLAVLTEGQLTQQSRPARKTREKKDTNRQKIQSYTDLTPGDLVVHIHHGIGRFSGIQRMPVDGVEKDYIRIDYAGSDCLYVPVTQLDYVSKYIGSGEDGETPHRLNKLGGTDWSRQKSRAKKAAQDLAKGLIQLYAERQRLEGYAFSPDSPWQLEFEEAFPYEETRDQLTAIEEIKRDMEQPRPMDRLLCGDVGYGKTEVAMRAIMKCVLDGKQAAILVPTTILAQQHYLTLCSRFQSFPVKIEVLSRFTSTKEAKRILEAAKSGGVDILVGTHKLLQKSMEFKNLGLLVIDEEQRFGVTHKERLKEMSRQIDVLTLSATPIPRTLNMALSGLRDMSTIEEPPQDRQPVQTYVLEHDWGVLEGAMRKELARGGQVYFLHNNTETINRRAAQIQQMLGPDVRVGIGHGKMSETELSSVMQAMVDGELDVLVCTTIIETGIDIPNVNTLIIENADRMGLAQLHQIRGRIGRSTRRAYAYLTYQQGKILQEVAAKRLSAIREYVEFGSGFKIAMRDLEIRGAGNLLGPEQSGFLMTVGYDLYLQLLEEAVLEERGDKKKVTTDCSADLTISAYIPESYVPNSGERLDLYRRIAAIRTPEASSDLLDEMLDRYGDPPKSVSTLLDVALLRAAAASVGITELAQKKQDLRLKFAAFDPESVVKVCGLAKYKRRISLSAGTIPTLSLRLSGQDVLPEAIALVEDLKLALDEVQKTRIPVEETST